MRDFAVGTFGKSFADAFYMYYRLLKAARESNEHVLEQMKSNNKTDDLGGTLTDLKDGTAVISELRLFESILLIPSWV